MFFGSLMNETAEHIFNFCFKIQWVWNNIGELIGKQICFPNGIILSGHWLEVNNSGKTYFVASVITAPVWLIWKARCNVFFRNTQPDFKWIANRAIAHVNEYSSASRCNMVKNLIFANITAPQGVLFFSVLCCILVC